MTRDQKGRFVEQPVVEQRQPRISTLGCALPVVMFVAFFSSLLHLQVTTTFWFFGVVIGWCWLCWRFPFCAELTVIMIGGFVSGLFGWRSGYRRW
jgi:hypothetical protein